MRAGGIGGGTMHWHKCSRCGVCWYHRSGDLVDARWAHKCPACGVFNVVVLPWPAPETASFWDGAFYTDAHSYRKVVENGRSC